MAAMKRSWSTACNTACRTLGLSKGGCKWFITNCPWYAPDDCRFMPGSVCIDAMKSAGKLSMKSTSPLRSAGTALLLSGRYSHSMRSKWACLLPAHPLGGSLRGPQPGLRTNTVLLPGTHSSRLNRYGPEPTTSVSGAVVGRCARRCGRTPSAKEERLDNATSTLAEGRFKLSLKVAASMLAHCAPAFFSAAPNGSRMAQRSMEATASAAVTALPSENFRPGRKTKVQARPSWDLV